MRERESEKKESVEVNFLMLDKCITKKEKLDSIDNIKPLCDWWFDKYSNTFILSGCMCPLESQRFLDDNAGNCSCHSCYHKIAIALQKISFNISAYRLQDHITPVNTSSVLCFCMIVKNALNYTGNY